MSNYYNPYVQTTGYPAAYTGNSYGAQPQTPVFQSYTPPPAPQQPQAVQSNVIGVDGEIGAKAYMVPPGMTGPIALWDTNDNVIYLRTYNAAGMPNPLRKLRYVEEEMTPNLPMGQSGASQVDTSKFVTKEDFEQLRQEIQAMSRNGQNQNANRNQNNQGRQQ